MAKNIIYAAPIGKQPQVAEALAGAAGILPGAVLIKVAGEFVNHNAVGQGGAVYIANINTLAQKGTEDAYANENTVFAFSPAATEQFNVRVAAGNNITALDTALSSDGAGALKIAATDGSEVVLAYAKEVNNFTAAGLCRVEIASFGYNAVGGA